MGMTGQIWIHGTALEAAIADERPVAITYRAASGDRTTRTIEPYEIVPVGEGHVICRAMDRRSGEPRSFRLDRIELLTVRPGGFELARDGGAGDDLMPEILVRYHGSQSRLHGVMRLLGICGCVRCAPSGVRYRLAEPGRHEALVMCVKPASITPLGDGEDDAEDAALARIRAEIAQVPVYDHNGDAAHWTPDYSR